METVFINGLTQRFFVRVINPRLLSFVTPFYGNGGTKFPPLIEHTGHMGKLFFDKTDVPAAFYTSEPNLRQVIDVAIETHVFLQVMRGDVVTPHRPEVPLAIAHNNVGLTFH